MKGIKITAYKLIHLLNNRKGEAMYSFYKSIAKSQKIPFSNGLRVIVTLLLVGLLSSSTALGQTYPVQANLSITTPCPNRLSSLFPMGSSRVTLSLFLRDAMQQDVQAKLRFTIEGQGIKLETSPSYLPTPFHLQGGVPIVLRTELEPYFNPNNLMVTGASAGTFIQNRVLPEGVYTFTVEVIEARRQVVISNKAQTILLVMENEAPTLISPQPNSVAEPNPVQNLFISWISPIAITPSLGIPINYELSIWDAPQGTDPNLAIRSLRPKETVETTRTNFVWNATNTELVVGNWYILAVKAIDPSGELSFKNNGLSQPVMFRYGTPCLPPINPTHSDITQKGAKIAWTPIGGASQFLVEIKPKADKNDTWSELNANKSTLEVTTMLPSKAYVYRVSSVCGFMQSAPTREAELTTLPMPEQRGECTGNLSIPPVDDQTPLNALTPGSIIMASGFMVTVDEVTNTEGTKFSGTGRATFPLFGFTLRVEFKNIQVNNLLQLLSGKIVALKNDDVTFLNNQPNTNNNTFDYSNPQDTLVIPGVIDTVYQNDNGDWVVVSTDSTEVIVEPDPTGTLIIDSTGGGVVVGPGGYQPYNPGTGGNNPTGSNGDLPNKLASKRVTFTKGGYQHRNGFEPVNKNMPSNYYQSITIGDSTLLLPWKSVGTTGQDKLFATPVEDPAHTFAFQNGNAVSASTEGTSYGVWVTTPPAGEDNLLALSGADTSLAGAIRVKAYSPIRRVLKVIPVGDNKPMFSAASLQTELNRIYAQALMEWEVSFTQPLQSTNWDVAPLNFVELPETDYSTEMRAIWQAFLAEQTYDRNAVYLFVVTGFNKADTRGYMPLRSGYGFISTAATARDAAHELGHGVFNLRHTFSPYNRYQLPESTTSNLMDYKNGTDLLKYQWDYIHDPEGGLFLFEDSEEGESQTSPYLLTWTDFSASLETNGENTVSFLAPSGYPITVKGTNIKCYVAAREGSIVYINQKGQVVELDNQGNIPEGSILVPAKTGAIYGFNIDGVKWLAEVSDNHFHGYYSKEEAKYLLDVEYTKNKATSNAIDYGVYYYIDYVVDRKSQWGQIRSCFNPNDGWVNLNENNKDGYRAAGKTQANPVAFAKQSCNSKWKQQLAAEIKATAWNKNFMHLRYINGGIIYSLKENGTTLFFYCHLNDDGSPGTFYQYFEDDNDFKVYERRHFQDDFFKNVWTLVNLTGHTTLDILGSVPVGGEVFDVINCGWYLLEGEGGEAALCIVSVLPIVDIALKGGKYSIKLLLNLSTSKAFKQLVKSLPAEQLAALSRIASTIDPTNAEHYLNTLEQIAGLAAEYPQHVAVLEQLAKAIPSPASLQRITERIKQLGESTTKLLDDLAKNPTFAKEFFAKAGDNPGLVESWKILSNGSTSLKSIDNINAVHAFRAANPGIADDAIQAAFDGLKTSRKQPFINALGSCADNKNLIGSLKKSKLASVDEIKDALNKMRDYKTGKPQSGNLGYLEDNIQGVTLDKNKMWESVSLADARKEIHIFDAIEATGSSGTWLRITDSEYRMLNDLAQKLGGVKGKSFPEITGTLKIVSENPYCTSCQGVIQQFSEMFPNIEIKLIDGIR